MLVSTIAKPGGTVYDRGMNKWLPIAAVNGALAVLCGAFAAHGLRARLDAHALEIFETGARYHMYHALAMGLAAFAMRDRAARPARLASSLFLAGIVLFSGSLYALALSGDHWLGFVTPFGGIAFLGGWIALAMAASRLK
jgi:uncharacterized membrane protein YgdD (TMEM256/DUF423 family)